MRCNHCERRCGDLDALQKHQKAKNHCYCRECDRYFAHTQSAEQHRSALHSFKCFLCNRHFVRPEALHQHQKDTSHCYCRECDRSFSHPDAVEQHRLALHAFTCPHCNRVFTRLDGLQRHQKSTKHCYGAECDRLFVNAEALGQHLKSSIHVSQFHCCVCDRDFVDEQALEQHLASKVHKSGSSNTASSFKPSNWPCEDCERDFQDKNSLEQHRSSVIHKPLSNFTCFGDRRCKKIFTSPSAWLLHLESGACRSKITRGNLNMAVQLNDADRLITGGRNEENSLLNETHVSGRTSSTGSFILTPVTGESFDESPLWPTSPGSQPGLLTPDSGHSRRPSDTLSLTARLSCPFCPLTRKPFDSIEALRNHLSSPAHSPKIFHCPLSFAKHENQKATQLVNLFSTLSGLMQHLESGACQGGDFTFRKTVDYIERNLGNMGLRRLRLLN